jgi:transposase
MPGGFHAPYPAEFRAEAVRLVREGGRTLSDVAQSLGVTTESLRQWLKQADLDAGRRSDGLTSDEREELRLLRRENQRLRQEKEILKRAAAFFAAETNPIR